MNSVISIPADCVTAATPQNTRYCVRRTTFTVPNWMILLLNRLSWFVQTRGQTSHGTRPPQGIGIVEPRQTRTVEWVRREESRHRPAIRLGDRRHQRASPGDSVFLDQ